MIKCTGKMKIGYLRKLADTGKTFVIGGYLYDKDDHAQINIGFTAWGDTAKTINSYAEKGSVLVFHDATLKNSNPFDKTKTDENKEREIILNNFSFDEIQQFDESSKSFLTVWKAGMQESRPQFDTQRNERPAKPVELKEEKLTISEDDFPFD